MNENFLSEVLRLSNIFRAENGLAPLVANPELAIAAQRHSQDMAQKDFFAHTGLDGKEPWDRAADAGYDYRAIAENIAAGQRTPEEVVNGWINSPGHRRNLLNPTYTDLGVGYVNLENDTGSVNYNTYWTQLFGSGDSVAEQAPSLPPVTPAKAPEPTVVAEMPAAPMQPETPAAAPNTADMTADAPDALQPVAQPVVQLSFEESLCRIANDMATEGVANNAKLYGDAEWTEGKVDGGILLDGMDDLITINRSPEINLGESVDQRTISMGFNADDVSAERELVIFEEGGFLRGLNLYIEDDLLYFGGWSGEENDWEDSWVSLGNVSLTTRFENGFGFGGNSGLAGSVDEVQMFNDALTGSQIQ